MGFCRRWASTEVNKKVVYKYFVQRYGSGWFEVVDEVDTLSYCSSDGNTLITDLHHLLFTFFCLLFTYRYVITISFHVQRNSGILVLRTTSESVRRNSFTIKVTQDFPNPSLLDPLPRSDPSVILFKFFHRLPSHWSHTTRFFLPLYSFPVKTSRNFRSSFWNQKQDCLTSSGFRKFLLN